MHYSVGDQTFFNKFQAVSHALKHGLEVKFDMYESAFDQCDWSSEPVETWDQLLDIRANQIAAKNKPIVMYFSGGTDSWTMYKVFERNRIHIDVMYLRRRRGDADNMINERVFELLNGGLYDPTTRVIIREDEDEFYDQAYDSEDWIWTKQIRHEFTIGFTGDAETQRYLAQQLGTDDFVAVTGFEKARLFFDQFRVHSFLPDFIFNRLMGIDNLECFYITPDLPKLHVKQSYLMLNWIQQKNPGFGPRDLMAYNEFSNPDKFSWDDYATANGRFGEIAVSGALHSAWQNMKLVLPKRGGIYGSEHVGPGAHWFQSKLGTRTLDNFVKGIQSFANDPVGQYLLTDPENLYKIKPFNSKPYRLTFQVK
jgi:hypothetical protein